MNGVTIGEKHSYKDFNLILSGKVIAPPSPQYSRIKIPLKDAPVDLTEQLAGCVKYDERIITLTFTMVDPIETWATKISEIENYLHGEELRLVFDDDLAFYYIGRVSVNRFTSNKKIGTIVVECKAEPFKYDIQTSSVDWEWDIFDFESGIINEMNELIVEGERKISLICRKKRMFPIFTVSAPMTVIYDGEEFELLLGSQKMYDIFLVEGENELVFKGDGTVSIDYIGGSL